MCGNIKKLRYPDRPATDEEIYAAALQFVRKVSNVRKPSVENQAPFDEACKQISRSVKTMLKGLRQKRIEAAKSANFRPL